MLGQRRRRAPAEWKESAHVSCTRSAPLESPTTSRWLRGPGMPRSTYRPSSARLSTPAAGICGSRAPHRKVAKPSKRRRRRRTRATRLDWLERYWEQLSLQRRTNSITSQLTVGSHSRPTQASFHYTQPPSSALRLPTRPSIRIPPCQLIRPITFPSNPLVRRPSVQTSEIFSHWVTKLGISDGQSNNYDILLD